MPPPKTNTSNFLDSVIGYSESDCTKRGRITKNTKEMQVGAAYDIRVRTTAPFDAVRFRVLRGSILPPARPPGTAHDLPRLGTRRFAVADHLYAIDEDVAHAGGELLRMVVGGVIGDRGGIEHDDVGEIAGSELAAILELEIVRGQRREAAHGIGERRHVLVAHVTAEEAREIAVGARVRLEFQEHAFGRVRALVRTERHPGLGKTELHVVLGHQKVYR